MNPISDLVDKLEDASALDQDNYKRALFKHAAITIRQLQGTHAQQTNESMAAFCDKLAEAFTRLSTGMRGHA